MAHAKSRRWLYTCCVAILVLLFVKVGPGFSLQPDPASFRGPSPAAGASANQTTVYQTIVYQTIFNSNQTIINHEQTINPSCPRFAYMGIQRQAGLGHRFSEVVMGMVFAFENDATFVYQDDAFSVGDSAHGTGSYPWMDAFFPASTHFHLLSAVRETWRPALVKVSPWVAAGRHAGECNILLQTCGQCCSFWQKTPLGEGLDGDVEGPHWCQTHLMGIFNAAKVKVRTVFDAGRACPGTPAFHDLDEFVIVWHLRVGDVVLNAQQAYYRKILQQLAPAFVRVPSRIFFVGENGTKEAFPFLGSAGTIIEDLPPRESLCHMIQADMIITSGSSFAAMAVLLASRPVVLQAAAKEGTTHVPAEPRQGGSRERRRQPESSPRCGSLHRGVEWSVLLRASSTWPFPQETTGFMSSRSMGISLRLE